MWKWCIVVPIVATGALSNSLEQTVGYRKFDNMYNPKLFPYISVTVRLLDCANLCAQQGCVFFQFNEDILECNLYTKYISYKGDANGAIYLQDVKPPCPNASECLPNIALNKPVSMSSTYPYTSAQQAVDGDTNGAHPTCAHGAAENGEPWLLVNLQQPYKVSYIHIYNRVDCCSERLTNIVLSLGPSPTSLQAVYYHEGPDTDHIHVIWFVPAITTEFVKVSLNGTGLKYLTICELFVFGEP